LGHKNFSRLQPIINYKNPAGNMKAMMKITLTVLGFAALILVTLVLHETYLAYKYKATPLNITETDLKLIWGKEDRNFICSDCDNNTILFYETPLNEFVFTFDKNSGLLIHQYEDW